jgi:acetylglutamate synthase
MNDLAWSNISLENVPDDILPDLVAQINKDFNEHSLLNVSEEYLLEEVVSVIKNFISDLSKRGADLQHLLYRIDVPEKDFLVALEENDLDKLSLNLSRLIIKREIQKVLIRRHFKDIN